MSRSIGCRSLTRSSPISTSPRETSSRPAIMRRTVVFPEPEGPTRTRNSPSGTARSTPFTATVPPGNTFVTPRSSTSAMPLLPVRLLRDQVAVPERASLQCAPLGLEVDRDDPEPARVAVLPLEVVEQRPHVVAAHVDALVDCALERREVAAEVVEPPRVLDHVAALERRVVERCAVLGDQEREIAVVPLETEQQLRQRLPLDPPPHRRPGPGRLGVLDARDAVPVAQTHDGRRVEVDAEEVDRRRDRVEVALADEVERPEQPLVALDHVGGVAPAQDRVQEPAVAVAVEPQ